MNALIDELDTLRSHQARIAQLDTECQPARRRTREARPSRASPPPTGSTSSRPRPRPLPIACARREIPQPARAAAYSALVGLIANDLLPHATFLTLYESWEQALDGLGDSPAILRGEEVLFHIG